MADSSFNVNDYWLTRGKTYVAEQRLSGPYYAMQEEFLLQQIRNAGLPVRTMLEVGCGFGRITRRLAEAFPDTSLTAVDLSPDQLAHAQARCEGLTNVTFAQYDLQRDEPPLTGPYDTIIAIEVLLHHPDDIVAANIERWAARASAIVTLDWSEPWSGAVAPHVWVRDYEPLYRAAGMRCATLVLPEKIEGQQQRLFIAQK